jgi:dihydrofolate reductase
MGKTYVDMAMSLDGFISGPNGEDGGLHDWYFSPSGDAEFVKQELLDTMGAMILGKRAFSTAPESEGFDTPYKVPHFILTHTPRVTIPRGGMEFIFSTDGIEGTLQKAKAAAGEKDVCVAGGADTARQFLEAGLLDELHIHLVPVLLGGGLRLFDVLPQSIKLEKTRTLESAGVTHLRYRVIK